MTVRECDKLRTVSCLVAISSILQLYHASCNYIMHLATISCISDLTMHCQALKIATLNTQSCNTAPLIILTYIISDLKYQYVQCCLVIYKKVKMAGGMLTGTGSVIAKMAMRDSQRYP